MKIRPFFKYLLLLLALVALASCAELADFDEFDPRGESENSQSIDDPISAAELALINHDIRAAREIYATHLELDPANGALAAGLALTDLLLVAEMPEVTELLVESLGASRGFQANQFFFAEGGLLYWASRGARWKDDGPYQGIASLLRDELPWTPDLLESWPTFVDPLDQPVDKLVRKLVTFANALKGVDLNLELAVNDPNFVRIFIPGEVFHDSGLTLVLGRSELSAIRAGIGLLRSLIYFVAAYENSWSLQEAFGSWRGTVDFVDQRFIPGYRPRDYSFDLLDRHLFRKISSPERLSASRTSLRHALQTARDSVQFGQVELSSTTMKWDQIEIEEARKLDELLNALVGALDEPQALPNTDPELTLYLAPFFGEGRELSEEIPWLNRVELVSEDGSREETGRPQWDWTLNPEAFRAFWQEGVVEPIPEDGAMPALLPGDRSLADYFDLLLGEYREKFEDVFLITR